jgi:hypothetical protein
VERRAGPAWSHADRSRGIRPRKERQQSLQNRTPFSRDRDGGFELDVDAWSYLKDKEQSAQGTECSETKRQK